MKKKTLRRLFNFKQINDLTYMVKLNRNMLNFEWENKMNKMDKVILFLYAILAVYMLITSLLSKKRHFNNEKYLTIFNNI